MIELMLKKQLDFHFPEGYCLVGMKQGGKVIIDVSNRDGDPMIGCIGTNAVYVCEGHAAILNKVAESQKKTESLIVPPSGGFNAKVS